MDQELHLKYDHLREILTEIGETAVAFSGGVDSALLLHVAGTVCRRVFAVTAVSELFPSKEQEEAVNMIAEDVAMIKISGQDQEESADGMVDGILGGFFGRLKDAQVINAAEYKM